MVDHGLTFMICLENHVHEITVNRPWSYHSHKLGNLTITIKSCLFHGQSLGMKQPWFDNKIYHGQSKAKTWS